MAIEPSPGTATDIPASRLPRFTIAEPESTLHIYNHPLIDWGSALAGTAVAIAVGFALTILGVAIGATAMNPWAGTSEQAPAWTIGGGLWIIFSNLVALQIGAFVAVRGARWPDHHGGMLQGIVVWALAFTIAAGVLGFGVTHVLDNVSVKGAAKAAVNAAQAVTGDAVSNAPTMTPAQTDDVQDATALTAWWAFAMMVLGAVGAIAGGKLGSAHPDWHARERLAARATTLADKI